MGEKAKKPRRSTALPAAVDNLKTPLPSPLGWVDGWSAGNGSVDSSGEPVPTQPTTQPTPSFVISYCERLDDGLCVNHRLDHIVSRDHKAQLEMFLTKLGLLSARRWVRRYGVVAADQVAAEMDFELAQGLDPLEWAHSPGAVIHSRIRERAEELGLWHA